MGDVTGLAPESLRERELAALLCSTALLGANSSPVRDQSGCHAKCTQLREQKGTREKMEKASCGRCGQQHNGLVFKVLAGSFRLFLSKEKPFRIVATHSVSI